MGFIGRNPAGEDNVYIITGDSGTGLTHTTLGAKIVTDMIVGRYV
jgi:glycine/D-amino acid oxidase-like deaminating enzyme